MGRSVSADLRFHGKVQHPVRSAVRGRPALVSRAGGSVRVALDADSPDL
jgi:hypothetical protein